MLHNREDLRIYLDDDFVAIVNIYKKQKHMKAESGFTCDIRTPCSLYNNINVFTLYNAPKIPSYQIVTKRVTYTYTIYYTMESQDVRTPSHFLPCCTSD